MTGVSKVTYCWAVGCDQRLEGLSIMRKTNKAIGKCIGSVIEENEFGTRDFT